MKDQKDKEWDITVSEKMLDDLKNDQDVVVELPPGVRYFTTQILQVNDVMFAGIVHVEKKGDIFFVTLRQIKNPYAS